MLSEANDRLAGRIRDAVGTRSLRSLAKATGFQRETIRRYLQGTTTIPAVFVVALCESYGFDPVALLRDPNAFKREVSGSEPDHEPRNPADD